MVLSLECISFYDKGLQTSFREALKLLRLLKDKDIRVGAYFTVGLPESSLLEDIVSVVGALGLRLDDANWIPFTTLRGSGYEKYASAGFGAHAVTVLATTLFHLGNSNIVEEGLRNPQMRGNLIKKAKELLLKGGPPPQREMP